MSPTLYTQPGDHYVNGRYWRTECGNFSTNVIRCRTEIWATKVVQANGKYYNHNGWVFNNLTYLPAPKSIWGTNDLAHVPSDSGIRYWTSAGREWKTECNTANTGSNGCRVYIMADRMTYQNGRFVKVREWTFNNIVMFSTSTLAHQTTIPPRSAPVANMPVEQEFVPPAEDTFRADYRCKTGRALCVSKDQRKMAWMVNGSVLKVVDVRFGSELTPTRNGAFKVEWKSRNHTSSIYGTWMPFAMFFSGGQAVHYSPDFAANGYNGASHGCVNVRDYDAIKWLFDEQVRVGDKVIVYY